VCILIVAYLHQFCAWGRKCIILVLFGTNLHLFVARLASRFKNYADIASSNDAIWDEFIKQHQHQSIKKNHV
jgi:hypothetical protein